MLAVITEPLTHGTASEGSKVLKRSGLGSGGSDDDGVLHGIVLLKSLDELGNSRTLLANGDVDTVELLGLILTVVPSLLVEHGIDTDSGLTGLTVTNDQLTLTTANWHHGVDTLHASLYRLVDGLAGQNAGGLDLSTAAARGIEGTLAVNGVTQSINDTAQQLRTDGDIDLTSVSALSRQVVYQHDKVNIQSVRYA